MNSNFVKRLTIATLAVLMTLSTTACSSTTESSSTATGSTVTTTVERPSGVSEADWEAMQLEPVFGTEIKYLYNGGACVSAIYMAELLGYYGEYGINATYVQGSSVVETVGTAQCQWGTDHVATMLVPVTNRVNMTFVAGAHIGCKSVFVPIDSPIQSVSDLVGKTVAIHDGIGNSDHNICYRLFDEFGIDPTSDVKFLNIADSSATIAALESGEVDASIFSDYFMLTNYRDDMRMLCSITYSEAFQDEPCCVTAMNNDFIAENPIHAKYATMAIKRAGQFNNLNAEEAVQYMFDTDKLTGEFQNQIDCWDPLYFGLSDVFTEKALREIADDYIRLGIITQKDMTVDDVMDLAWNSVCPDTEIEGLTVADPITPENAVIPVVHKENPNIPEDFAQPAN